jgi:hypothetical protein
MELRTPQQLDIEDLPDTVSAVQRDRGAVRAGSIAEPPPSASVPDATGYSNSDADHVLSFTP